MTKAGVLAVGMNVATRVVAKGREVASVSAEICVVGSGAAGIMAALTAARLGRRTILIEGMPAVGGQLVGSLLGTICGLYSTGERPKRFTFGPVTDMLTELYRQGALQPRRAIDTIVLHYDEMLCARWAETALVHAGVEIIVGAVLRSVHMDGRRIVELDVSTRWGDLKIKADGFIDASGDAAVAWNAGLAVREPEEPQWGTQMIVIEGYDERAKQEFEGFNVERALREKRGTFGLTREDGFIFTFPGREVATVNLTHMPNPTDPIGASRAALEGRDQADRLMAFLKQEYPDAMANARIRAYGQPGIRQTRWIVAAHQLTIAEVRSGHRSDDAIARCSWPVEAHNSAERIYWEYFNNRDHVHYVPLRSLAHRDADNLVAAGRCIDGDTAALASVRVMGPCFAMGQAAAHALDLTLGRSVHEIAVPKLRERVRENLERDESDVWCQAA